jgi:group I intron endonuclease
MAFVYLITNSTNGKRYVGKTTKTIASRFRGHLAAVKKGSASIFHRALRKYGKDAFVIEVLEETDNHVGAERRYIAQLRPEYNMTDGGEGYSSIGWIWITNGEEAKRILKTEILPEGYRPGRTKAFKQAFQQAMIGRKVSDESRARMSAAHMGHKASDETKAKMRMASALRWT